MELDTLQEKFVNLETGQETFRDYSATEMLEVEKARLVAQEIYDSEISLQLKRKNALEKLELLGLTQDDLKALGL